MPIHAKLERTKVADRTWTFNLLLSGDVEKVLYLARIKNGSMTLVNYDVSQDDSGRNILSAFFYVNIMGHDLDQWIHKDLATGEQVPNYIGPRQKTGKNPELDPFEARHDKRPAAAKLRQSVKKWEQGK